MSATGALSKLVLGFESTFGTLATAGFEVPFASSGLKSSRTKSPSKIIRGNFNPGKPSGGNYSVSGTIVVPVCSISFWYWCKAAFNALTTTGASSPYTHTFKMTGATPRGSISIEHQFLDLDTPQYFQYTGGKISAISFSVGDEGELLSNISIVAAKETIAAAPFDASPTVVGYSPLDNSHASFLEGGSSIANSTKVSCAINFNPDTSKYVIGSGGYLGLIPDGIIGVSGTLDYIFEDVALLNKAKASTESSIKQVFSASATSKVEVLCPEIEFGESSPEISGPQGIMCSLPYEGFYDNATEASAIVVTVTNTEAHA